MVLPGNHTILKYYNFKNVISSFIAAAGRRLFYWYITKKRRRWSAEMETRGTDP